MRIAALVPADVRARLKALRLSARNAGHGQGIGQHVSRSRGAGLEFAQYRAYEPGDEPRLIDWKLYGRSDRYFVRDSTRDYKVAVISELFRRFPGRTFTLIVIGVYYAGVMKAVEMGWTWLEPWIKPHLPW